MSCDVVVVGFDNREAHSTNLTRKERHSEGSKAFHSHARPAPPHFHTFTPPTPRRPAAAPRPAGRSTADETTTSGSATPSTAPWHCPPPALSPAPHPLPGRHPRCSRSRPREAFRRPGRPRGRRRQVWKVWGRVGRRRGPGRRPATHPLRPRQAPLHREEVNRARAHSTCRRSCLGAWAAMGACRE